MVTREDQKVEALIRMKRLNLHPNVIREFKNSGKLNITEPPYGALFWMEKHLDKIKEFEEEYNALAYHVIHNYADFGELLTVLYVSAYEEEWLRDMEELKNGLPCCYVINLNFPEFSEFGHCEILPALGGVLRIS